MIDYRRSLIELEAPEQLGYDSIRYNLSESSFADQSLGKFDLDLSKLLLAYGDHLGNPAFRQAIAVDYGLQADQVLLTSGAATALFIITSALLSKTDHLVVMRPNYATNLANPMSMGCEISYLDMTIDKDFRISVDEIAALLRPNTRLISLTTPHNPTGMMLTESRLRDIGALAEQHDCWVLVDETYRDLSLHTVLPPLAASISERFISVSSMSKSYGIPGIRLGWLITQSAHLLERFLAAKEQIFICGSTLDEAVGYEVYRQRQTFLPWVCECLMANLGILCDWLAQEKRLDYVLPEGGAVCFPRVNVPIDTQKFYRNLYEQYGTYVGRGAWFDFPDEYMRLGFGYPSKADLVQGLNNISDCITTATL